MLKKGALFLKIISLICIIALFFSFFEGDSKFEKESLSLEDAAALTYYAESMGYSLSEAITNQGAKTYLATITSSRAETFSGNTVDDFSRPTNSYLPQGTTDYCDPNIITDPKSGRKYYKLASGYRIYADEASAEITEGKLNSSNNISFSSSKVEGKKLYISFKTDEKIPFKLSYGKQVYFSETAPDYSVFSCDFSYIDITFFNSDSLDIKALELPENKIFSKVKPLKTDKKRQSALRIYLKEKGAFYGWDAKYNALGELEFSFLQPPKMEIPDSLEGIKILIDPGHGGDDPGAPNVNGSYRFGEQNHALLYAKELSEQLRALGATVTFTRVSNTTVSLNDRCAIIRNANADLVISLHFNASENKKQKGFFMGYFCPFSFPAAKTISESIMKTDIFSPLSGGVDWHYFRPSRVTSCPVILAESGYISNREDYEKIRNPEIYKKYIEGMTNGICNYFNSISK